MLAALQARDLGQLAPLTPSIDRITAFSWNDRGEPGKQFSFASAPAQIRTEHLSDTSPGTTNLLGRKLIQ
jgi:hypothetical protein